MGDRVRGFPKRCRCGEAVVCLPFWERREIEDLIEKVENIEGTSATLQKGFNACENELENLALETRVCETVVEKEIGDCKMQLRSLKNIVVVAMFIVVFLKFIF
ncbi:uncharacterized protein LOC111215928 [Brassica napus]|uniref:uncharacterized protein LOC111215928 n=1 Tax=Brassica napus TaxID=3708 RepID=UPI00207AFFC2|nr:uncharacterized protein LOC111215928 [Brassica napus]